MGFVGSDSQEGSSSSNYGGQSSSCSWKFLTRRKKVDSNVTNNNNNDNSHHGEQLAKELTVPHLMAIGNSIFSFSFFYFLKLCGFDSFQSCFLSGKGCWMDLIIFCSNFCFHFS
jgi:hypothetical protein